MLSGMRVVASSESCYNSKVLFGLLADLAQKLNDTDITMVMKYCNLYFSKERSLRTWINLILKYKMYVIYQNTEIYFVS